MNKTLITFFTVLFCLTSSVGYSQNIVCKKTGFTCPEIDIRELIYRDGNFYKKFTDILFTGEVTGKQKGSMNNGKREGTWIFYYDNGQLRRKGNFKNGNQEGSWVSYHDNGQLNFKGNYKNDKREGSSFTYNKYGIVLKEYSGTYKNGKKISD